MLFYDLKYLKQIRSITLLMIPPENNTLIGSLAANLRGNNKRII